MNQDQLKTLLNAGLLAPGSFLSSPDPRYSCTIRADGAIDLTNWPVPLRTLRAATRAAQELIMYGSDIGARNIRTANPSSFWSYFDEDANRQEPLQKLVQQAAQSLQSSKTGSLAPNSRT